MDGDIIQRSEAWYKARLGSLGASCIHEVVARTKTGYSTSRANRLAALVCERLTGVPESTYQNAAMLHGIETEPEARAAYTFYSNAAVVEVGLVRHPTIAGTHASPDGLVGEDGLLELKCPQPAAHLALLMGGSIPDKYVTQMLWQMVCCERLWCDFVSYSPAFPEDMRLVVRRLPREPRRIAELELEVRGFLDELDKAVAKLTEKRAA